MKGLQGVMREEYSRDLTNLDLAGRGLEIWGASWWENVYNLFNNFGCGCDIIEAAVGRK